ncbi:hypothetical protein PPYR_11614 [Photinus pyralis]|uniref:Complex I assembly factor TIMMDC1, mitochondrial n=2 Tax=Photinus pyralis TaxID=7054 RepID=A0A1Y1MDP3_PHOPY|nr:RPII140-upstream gene protein [Photinus pyralis]KAB0794775.1 hypothetical protein PPYR_11614 [Photinus pyralis]
MIARNFGKLLPCLIPIDNVSKELKTVKEADLTVVQKESGWERVKSLFEKDDFGRITPELQSIINVGCASCFLGMLYGGITNTRETYIDFVKNNQATSFKSHLEAKKTLQDRMTLSFAKGAFKWGWRLTVFSSTYIVVSTLYSTYRGKNGILEHTAAGTVAGSLYKFKLGPPAMLVGGLVGGALGSVAGVATNVLLKLSGMTMQEVRYWNYKWLKKRSDKYNEEFKKHIEKDQIELLTERELAMEKSPPDLSTIETSQ